MYTFIFIIFILVKKLRINQLSVPFFRITESRFRKNHAKLIRFIDKKLSSEEFILKHRTTESAFTRKRSFSFKSLSLFILSSIQSSLQRELDRFFRIYNDSQITEQFVSKSAFSQARKKINPEAFKELNSWSVKHFYENYRYHKWKNHRLIAIDGSEVLLPSNAETIAKFGDYSHRRSDKSVVLSRFSKCYDVLNRIAIDAVLTTRKEGEGTLAIQHLEKLSKDDLVIFDRGYPSLILLRTFLDTGINFCSRIAVGNWTAAKDLVNSNNKETVVTLEIPNHLKKKFYSKGLNTSPIKLRLIKIRLKTGEDEVLITSLMDEQIYPHSCFKKLYNLRWGVEESYKVDKHQIRLEDFSGYSVQSIMQEFHAMILLSNLAAIFSYLPQKEIKKVKHNYKVSATIAISKMRDNLVSLFRNIGEINLIEKLVNSIWLNLIPIRNERSFERKVYRRRRYYYQYKIL
nr:IS4 family transposase [uncultured Draconibacterium sp.]